MGLRVKSLQAVVLVKVLRENLVFVVFCFIQLRKRPHSIFRADTDLPASVF